MDDNSFKIEFMTRSTLKTRQRCTNHTAEVLIPRRYRTPLHIRTPLSSMLLHEFEGIS